MESPQIAILTDNTLEGIGMSSIIERMMPMCATRIFTSIEELKESGQEFFHHFVSSHFLLRYASELRTLQRVVVMAHGEASPSMQGFPLFNVCQPEQDMVRSMLQLAHAAHHKAGTQHMGKPDGMASPKLTRRETDVLKLIVRGMLNKEIASQLGVALTTVITHRKNLTAKLHIRSVSGLTIYAVTHGLVNIEEI